MKKSFSLVLSFSIIVLLSSCASIISDSSYPISFSSNPEKSNITIKDSSHNTIYKGTTPAIVNLDSGNGFFKKSNYTIIFSKEGYDDTIYTLESHIDGWYWGNLLVGGVLGMLIIDPMTGAMWSLDDSVFVNLEQLPSKKALSIMNINDIPKEWETHLNKII